MNYVFINLSLCPPIRLPGPALSAEVDVAKAGRLHPAHLVLTPRALLLLLDT